MAWLKKVKSLIPVNINIDESHSRRTIVQYYKVNTFELEICVDKGIIRERRWWRSEKIDIFHRWPDGTLEHRPIR